MSWVVAAFLYFQFGVNRTNPKAIPALFPGSFICGVENTTGLSCKPLTFIVVSVPTISFFLMIPKQQATQTSLVGIAFSFVVSYVLS